MRFEHRGSLARATCAVGALVLANGLALAQDKIPDKAPVGRPH
jgi:hypothetical protein